jgi:beta-mannanase
VDNVRAAGAIPFIRLMPRVGYKENRADPKYTMARIISGEFDAELIAWGQAAAAQPFPMLVEFGTEVNGFWFQWSGKHAGGGTTTGYGDPAFPDGPERFRDAYRHIHDVITAQGADNLTWFWHVTAESNPNVPWNSIANYYPGDDYVDWIGLSNYGPIFAEERFRRGFATTMDRAYPQLAALSPDNPIAVLEYAVRQDKKKAAWTRAAVNSVASGRWPRIKALSYWHERYRNADGTVSNLHVNSDKKTLKAYRAAIANPVFGSTPFFTGP